VDHGGGIPPSALLFICFMIAGIGLAIALRDDKKKKK
jgi:hypothetical protein